METLIILWHDIVDSIFTIDVQDLIRPVGLGIWLIALFLPLKNMDRKDFIAGMVYAFILSGIGTAIVIAIPETILNQPPEPEKTFITIASMGVIASIRWGYQGNSKKVIKQQGPKTEIKSLNKLEEKQNV